MKRILAGVALVGTAVSAQAADLAVKAPYLKAPVVAVYDWTGFYIGVNAGVGLGRDLHRCTTIRPPAPFNTTYLQPQGALGGGQIGYNWQTDSFLGPMLIGVEADIQGTGMSDGRTTLSAAASARSTTIRSSTGSAPRAAASAWSTGPVVSYFTGGFAYGNVKTIDHRSRRRCRSRRTAPRPAGPIGSGVEAALGGNWTGKIEYLYLNLGNKNDAVRRRHAACQHRDPREHLPRRPELSHRRQRHLRPGCRPRTGPASISAAISAAPPRATAPPLAGSASTEPFNLSPDGFIGGGQIGYNWQAANWVFGIEADFQGSTQRDNRTVGAAVDRRLRRQAALVRHRARPDRLFGRLDSVLRHRRLRLWQREDQHRHAGQQRDLHQAPRAAGPRAPASRPRSRCSACSARTGPRRPNISMSISARPPTSSPPRPASTPPRSPSTCFRTGINYHFNQPVVAKY